MYRIIGTDGNEYGPVTGDLLRQWIADGRLNRQTLAQAEGQTGWKPMIEFPEFAPAFSNLIAAGVATPPPFGATDAAPLRSTGMAVASFVMGILSLVCLMAFAGIPAIIFGHIAHARARRTPALYGGTGFAIAGFVMGYCSLLMTGLVIVSFVGSFMPAMSQAKGRAESIACVNNMKQVGLAFRIWAGDNKDKYPFNVSTNAGGTLEFAGLGTNGFDTNAYLHLLVMSNELSNPRILFCPGDTTNYAAWSFSSFGPNNVSYLIHSGSSIDETNPSAVIAICPIHGHILHADGSVTMGAKKK